MLAKNNPRSRPYRLPSWEPTLRKRGLLSADIRYREVATDLARQVSGALYGSWNRLDRPGVGIAPQGMGTAFALEVTTVSPQVLEQTAPFHETMTVSRIASGGTPRKIVENVSSRAAISADGQRIAFIRDNDSENSLIVANSDGSDQTIVATRQRPDNFYPRAIAWTPGYRRTGGWRG